MNENTGLIIKGLREKYGYTQEQLSYFLDIKREISHYENGTREIPLEILEKLSDLFGVELDVFFIDNIDEALAEVVFAFRKDDLNSHDMKSVSEFGKIVKNYLKIDSLYESTK